MKSPLRLTTIHSHACVCVIAAHLSCRAVLSRAREGAARVAAAASGGTAASATSAAAAAGDEGTGASAAALLPSVSVEDAQRMELFYANWILRAREELKGSPAVYATAVTFFRRFFIHQVSSIT